MRLLRDFRTDVSYSIRMLCRMPGFTFVAVLSLALGVGANTAIFSLINTLMLRTLPVRDPEQLVVLFSVYPGEPRADCCFTSATYRHLLENNHVFSELIAATPSVVNVIIEGRDVDGPSVDAEFVGGNYFSALGVTPAIGRLIDAQDDTVDSTASPVAVVSWAFWNSRFNLDPAILGKTISIDGTPATIIGVVERKFVGLQVDARVDVWVPAAMESIIRKSGGQLGLRLVARLKPGVSVEQAQAEMNVLNQWRIEELRRTSRDPQWSQSKTEVVAAGKGFSRLRDRYGTALFAMMALAALLLLMACTNMASMLLSRAAARQRELALRISLGAGRLRLARQMLTESLILSTSGALAGILLASWGTEALVGMLSSGRQRIEIQVPLDWHVLAFAAGTAVVTGVVFGMAPAVYASQVAPASPLKEVQNGGEAGWRGLFRKALIVTQVGLAVVLLSSAGLFVRHLWNLRNLNLGFTPESVLLVSVDPSGTGFRRAQLSVPYRDLLARLQSIPGVRSASICATSPMSGAVPPRFADVEGFYEKPEDRRYLQLNWVGPKYFETLGIPLIAGRDFQFDDEGHSRVALINEGMSRYYFGSGNPIGKHVTFVGEQRPYEIVGVVRDAKYFELREPAPPTIYLNAFQEGRIFSEFVLRTDGNPLSVAAVVRRSILDGLKNARVERVLPLSKQMDASIIPERVIAFLSELFGLLGSVLAGLGVYGLLAYSVEQRIHEIGIRMALGATRHDLTRMVLKRALALVGSGLMIGIPIAIAAKQLAVRVIDRLAVESILPIASATAAIIAIGLVAAYIPARRAARVEPLEALRHE